MATITIKQNDRRPYLEAVLSHDIGGLVSLGGATVAVNFVPRTGGVAVVRAAEIVSEAESRVRYAWQSADTATVGDYDLEWEVKYADGTRLSIPDSRHDHLRIVDDIGDA